MPQGYRRIRERLSLWLRGLALRPPGMAEIPLLLAVSIAASLLLLATSGSAMAYLSASSPHSTPPGRSPVSQELLKQVDDIIALIQNQDKVPATAFRNRNRGRTLVNQFEAVQQKIEAGNPQGAVNQLEHAILPKLDGCASRDVPDHTDWIQECSAQEQLHSAIAALIEALNK